MPDFPLPIELVRHAPLITLHLAADPATLAALVPAPLQPGAQHRLVLNVWALDEEASATGVGAAAGIGVAYLAAEVAGPEGGTVDGSLHYPGRVWLRHWCSNAAVRDYAQRASGMALETADISVQRLHPNQWRYEIAAGEMRLMVSVRIGACRRQGIAARSVYYNRRLDLQGNAQLARYDVPSIADSFDVKAAVFTCEHPPAGLPVPSGDVPILSAEFRRMTVVPYISSGVLG